MDGKPLGGKPLGGKPLGGKPLGGRPLGGKSMGGATPLGYGLCAPGRARRPIGVYPRGCFIAGASTDRGIRDATVPESLTPYQSVTPLANLVAGEPATYGILGQFGGVQIC